MRRAHRCGSMALTRPVLTGSWLGHQTAVAMTRETKKKNSKIVTMHRKGFRFN